jgi:hypothetical protein
VAADPAEGHQDHQDHQGLPVLPDHQDPPDRLAHPDLRAHGARRGHRALPARRLACQGAQEVLVAGLEAEAQVVQSDVEEW